MVLARSHPQPRMRQCYAWIHPVDGSKTVKCTTKTEFRCPECGKPACHDHRDTMQGVIFCLACKHAYSQAHTPLSAEIRQNVPILKQRYHEAGGPPMERLRPNPALKAKPATKPVKAVAKPVHTVSRRKKPVKPRLEPMQHPSRLVRVAGAIGRARRKVRRGYRKFGGIAKFIPFTKANKRYQRSLERRHTRMVYAQHGMVQKKRRKRL